ncbi:hypothetical protein FGIG_11255 [Fasciola gigantica]|uniref:Uncharacterized protein n=1 Tax=Fasciola gigantica TaxID=46835 RepID=A0A504YHW2_FASGI|nr:hypothetical protein FGIG_11255 [Fasciola gigantica]
MHQEYEQTKPVLGVALGCVVGDDGQNSTTSDGNAEVLKYHFNWVHSVSSGDHIIRISNQATALMDDLVIYPGQIAEGKGKFGAGGAARSGGCILTSKGYRQKLWLSS